MEGRYQFVTRSPPARINRHPGWAFYNPHPQLKTRVAERDSTRLERFPISECVRSSGEDVRRLLVAVSNSRCPWARVRSDGYDASLESTFRPAHVVFYEPDARAFAAIEQTARQLSDGGLAAPGLPDAIAFRPVRTRSIAA